MFNGHSKSHVIVNGRRLRGILFKNGDGAKGGKNDDTCHISSMKELSDEQIVTTLKNQDSAI